MKTKINSIAKGLFTLALLVNSSGVALAQQAPAPAGFQPAPTLVAPPSPEGRQIGEEASPDEVAAQTQFCQYQYQYVCNAWGQCMYQYVWVCL
jgi:hypothetical protein